MAFRALFNNGTIAFCCFFIFVYYNHVLYRNGKSKKKKFDFYNIDIKSFVDDSINN